MAIITISRQNGSLGDEIADALASRLGTTVVSRKYALENFFGEINQGTLDRLNESAKFFDLTLPGSDRTYADILVERIRALASESKDKDLIILDHPRHGRKRAFVRFPRRHSRQGYGK